MIIYGIYEIDEKLSLLFDIYTVEQLMIVFLGFRRLQYKIKKKARKSSLNGDENEKY